MANEKFNATIAGYQQKHAHEAHEKDAPAADTDDEGWESFHETIKKPKRSARKRTKKRSKKGPKGTATGSEAGGESDTERA